MIPFVVDECGIVGCLDFEDLDGRSSPSYFETFDCCFLLELFTKASALTFEVDFSFFAVAASVLMVYDSFSFLVEGC